MKIKYNHYLIKINGETFIQNFHDKLHIFEAMSTRDQAQKLKVITVIKSEIMTNLHFGFVTKQKNSL